MTCLLQGALAVRMASGRRSKPYFRSICDRHLNP